jgi:hypothetical protein
MCFLPFRVCCRPLRKRLKRPQRTYSFQTPPPAAYANRPFRTEGKGGNPLAGAGTLECYRNFWQIITYEPDNVKNRGKTGNNYIFGVNLNAPVKHIRTGALRGCPPQRGKRKTRKAGLKRGGDFPLPSA